MGVDRREVLLVVPEPDTAALLEQGLGFVGFAVRRVGSGAEALAAVSEQDGVDLIVMDLAQPDVDGLVLVGDLRERTRAPIIVCGEGIERSEALLVFRLGADDYVAKPFDVEDVVARVEAALRRIGERGDDDVSPSPQPSPRGRGRGRGRGSEGEVVGFGEGTIVVGDLALDVAHHRVAVGVEEVRLSRSEYLLLSALMSRPDELLSRLDLARAVWGEQLAQVGRPIDQHMYRLRGKLQRAATKAGVAVPTIVSVPGFGYRLLAGKERAAA